MKIKLFGMDVDGVLTDGGVYLGAEGHELKKFNVHDGMGITLVLRAGILPFIITGRTSDAVARRACELGIAEVYQGAEDKGKCLRDLAGRLGVEHGQIAFIGDDLSDLPVLKEVGLPMAVANAAPEIKEAASFVTARPGGDGAVREACEHVIRLNGYEGPMSKLLWP